MRLFVGAVAVVLLGSCGGIKFPDLDCRVVGCAAGWECKPDPGQVSQWTCMEKPVVMPSPVPPSPEPSPSPTSVPTPSPTPEPPVEPTPTPRPSPVPTPIPSPKPWKCTEAYEKANDCGCCDGNIQWARRTTNWVCPDNFPGGKNGSFACTLDGQPAPCPVYDSSYGNGHCYSTGEGKQHISRTCDHIDRNGNILHHSSSGYLGKVCQPPVVQPSPSPTPNPSPVPSPTVGNNFPPPPQGTCNAQYFGKVSRVGINILTARDCGEKCKRDGYLGYVMNFSATPKSKPPYCGHQPERLECEQWTPCQEGINDLENASAGPGIFITMPGKFTNDVCDKRSDNTFNCHHKPKANETGLLTVTACPRGIFPGDPRCSSRTFDVQAEGYREVAK